jgi:hypothetical protein
MRWPTALLLPVLVLGSPASARDLGTVVLSPLVVEVNSHETFTHVFTVGGDGVVAGEALRLFDPQFHGTRWPWSWMTVDREGCRDGDVAADRYALVTVTTSATDVDLEINRGETDSLFHAHSYTQVEVTDGELVEGDTVTFVTGDTSQVSACALRVGPRSFTQVAWPLELWPDADADADEQLGDEVPTSGGLDIVAASEWHRSALVAPSQAVAGETFRLVIALLDRDGNPAVGQDLGLQVQDEHGNVLASLDSLDADQPALWHPWITLAETGVTQLALLDGDGLALAASDPLRVHEQPPSEGIWWGDIHLHHGHGRVTDNGEQLDENHDYARDVAGLHVAAETVKAWPMETSFASLWQELTLACEGYESVGTYVPLMGFEWMGNATQGHHNVYYDRCDGTLGPDSIPDLGAEDQGLFAWMTQTEQDVGVRAIAVPHATSYTGANWVDRCDDLRPLAEIFSQGWGDSSTDPIAGTGGVYSGLGQGNRLGFIGASDSHMGWAGNREEGRGAPGMAALTAFVAPELTRAAVFEALERRSTYATSGHRPLLSFSAQGGTVPMGGSLQAAQVSFALDYVGGTDITEARLLTVPTDGAWETDVEVLETWTPGAPSLTATVDLVWDERPRAVWFHALHADGEQTWGSPIWLAGDDDGPWRCRPDPGVPEEPEEPEEERGCREGCASADTSSGLAIWLALGLGWVRRQGRDRARAC